MQLFVEFMKEIDLARPGASDQVSEVDLSDAQDLRATLAGLPGLERAAAPVRCISAIRISCNRYRLLLGQHRPVALERRARGIGGFAILAAGGGES